MIFIYNCFAGTHTSSLASAIHLGNLPLDRIPTKQEIMATSYFNKLKTSDMGKIIYRGTDDEGNKVYTLGRGMSEIVVKSMESLIGLLHNESGLNEKVVLSNMSPTVTPAMSMGGFVSRRLGIDFLGVPFLIIGAKQAYKRIVELVALTRESARTMTGPVLVLENRK